MTSLGDYSIVKLHLPLGHFLSNLNMPFLFLVKHSKSTTNDSFVYCILFLSSCKIPHVMGRRLSIQHVAHSEET